MNLALPNIIVMLFLLQTCVLSDDSDVGLANSDITNISTLSNSFTSSSRSIHEDSIEFDNEGILEMKKNELYEGSTVSLEKSVFDLLKLDIKHKWTDSSLDDFCNWVSNILPQPNAMPQTKYTAFKFANDLGININEIKHFYCSSCVKSKTSSDDFCTDCNSSDTGVFYEFPLEDLIRYLFEKRDFADVLDEYHRSINYSHRQDGYNDIRDGSEYKRVKKHLTGLYDLLIFWGTDGVQVTKSSKISLNPLQFTFMDLPHTLRSKYMLIHTVWCDTVKPKMNVFLQPFVKSLERIFQNGGVTWIHPRTKVEHKSQIVAPLVVADAPVRADILNMLHHTGITSCNMCEQVADECKVVNKKNVLVTRRYFVYKVVPAKLRTHGSILKDARIAENLNRNKAKTAKMETSKGIKGMTIAHRIPLVDLSTCVTPEYMHSTLLGVTRQFLRSWRNSAFNDHVNSSLESIKPPNYITRHITDISKSLKASECLFWLLFYSLPIVREILDEKLVQHWMLFVSALFILLKKNIKESDLEIADQMLNSFVEQIKDIYGESAYTYNVHMLLHLVLVVRRWGPLWASSAFIFEDKNGFLSKLIHGTQNLSAELTKTLKLIYCINSLESRTVANLDDDLKFSIPIDISENIEATQFLSNQGYAKTKLYGRASLQTKSFTSYLYDRNMKYCNSRIEYLNSENDNCYGKIVCFLETEEKTKLCLINVFDVIETNFFVQNEFNYKVDHLLPVSESRDFVLTETTNIVRVLSVIDEFIGLRPNSVETKL